MMIFIFFVIAIHPKTNSHRSISNQFILYEKTISIPPKTHN